MRKPNFSFERKLWNQGLKLVAGVDEVGRGAWAGPVMAAAVIFPPSIKLKVPLNDSKKLTPRVREELAQVIKSKALFWAVGESSNQDVDGRGIRAAAESAMAGALDGITRRPEFILVDFFKVSFCPKDTQMGIKFGDGLSNSIAAASILAKVERDAFMRETAQEYPHYGFEAHKGYGTKLHQEMIRKHGLCEIHRTSFVPDYLKLN